MAVIRKIRLLSLLFAATLFVTNASATLEPLLPESSYHDGFVFYGDDPDYTGHLRGRIDFAVYDTENLSLADEISLADELDMPGQYIYAYQIFNDYPGISEEAAAYFSILNFDELPFNAYKDSIGSQDDENGGLEPSAAYFTPSNTRAIWEFEGSNILKTAEHSWFLVFSSDEDWTPGTYEIKGSDLVPVPEPITSTPEPGTITLLGVGAALTVCTRRRKSLK